MEELLLLDETAATATVTTGAIINPGYAGALLSLIVSSGTSLSLTIELLIYMANDIGSETKKWTVDDTAVTAVGERHLLVYPGAASADVGADIDKVRDLPVPGHFVAQVLHGNANSADYQLICKFIGPRHDYLPPVLSGAAGQVV